MSASWELDIWGRIRRSNEAARATLFATEDARRGVWLTLVSDLAQAYFELLALDVRLQIARNSTDAYQRTYDLFLDRFNLGAASRLETSRAQGALGEAQANIPQLESDIVAKENQISILLGTTPGPIPRGKPMYDQPVVPAAPARVPSTLLQPRPHHPHARQAHRRRDGTGHGREGARGGRRARHRSLSPGVGQLLRSARSPAAALPGPEHAGADSPEPSPRLRAALQDARRWLEPDGCRVGRPG